MGQDTNQFGQPIGYPLNDWLPPPFPPRTPLVGRICRLEPLIVASHGHELYQAFNADGDPRRWTYLSYGPFDDYDAFQKWLESTCLGADPLFYAVVDQASGKANGLASYMRIQPASGVIEVGHIHFSAALQRRTAATEALYLLLQRAFVGLGFRRCEWKCDALNQPSREAARRLGFTYEGTFRQATHYKGRNRDTAWFAIIDQDWPRLAAGYQRWLDPANFDRQGRQIRSLAACFDPVN